MGKGKVIVVLALCAGMMGICAASGSAVNAGDAVCPEGAELIRFDLHKSLNREVGVPAGIPGFFTYYYQGKEYHYGFRFDRNGTAAESRTFGTAYVWAPYSVIHYDAAGGKIVEYGTAVPGNKNLTASRGDGQLLEKGNLSKSSRRYATDYTIYGNSLELSEGRMPKVRKKGFVFRGWYVWEDNGGILRGEAGELAEREEFGTLWRNLNTQYKEETKILENVNIEKVPAEEITLYAKWEKIRG